MRGFIIALLVVGALLGGAFGFIAIDSRGEPEQAGTITAAQRVGVAEAEARQRSARETLDAPATKQILFGDVHAHTTFSMDAFAWSLPVLGGEGVHPPADACDYARFVAQLDFWAHTDHAESLTPRHWQLIRDTVRACNAAAGDPANPAEDCCGIPVAGQARSECMCRSRCGKGMVNPAASRPSLAALRSSKHSGQ